MKYKNTYTKIFNISIRRFSTSREITHRKSISDYIYFFAMLQNKYKKNNSYLSVFVFYTNFFYINFLFSFWKLRLNRNFKVWFTERVFKICLFVNKTKIILVHTEKCYPENNLLFLGVELFLNMYKKMDDTFVFILKI